MSLKYEPASEPLHISEPQTSNSGTLTMEEIVKYLQEHPIPVNPKPYTRNPRP